MHDHRAGKIMEPEPEARLEPGLESESFAPNHALKKGINKSHQNYCGQRIGPETDTFGDTA